MTQSDERPKQIETKLNKAMFEERYETANSLVENLFITGNYLLHNVEFTIEEIQAFLDENLEKLLQLIIAGATEAIERKKAQKEIIDYIESLENPTLETTKETVVGIVKDTIVTCRKIDNYIEYQTEGLIKAIIGTYYDSLREKDPKFNEDDLPTIDAIIALVNQ